MVSLPDKELTEIIIGCDVVQELVKRDLQKNTQTGFTGFTR